MMGLSSASIKGKMSFDLPKKYEHKSGTIVPRYENVG